VLNAYVLPLFQRYLSVIRERLAERGLRHEVNIMKSSGGIMSAATASVRPIHSLLSGPVGGAVGAQALARRSNGSGTSALANIVTADMGGTSFDASLILDGDIAVETRADAHGYPMLVPTVRVSAIGAGGGSIARIEGTSGLRVGPESAGAAPGPVCYGNGGTEPTVTDANLVLGRLDPAGVLGGEIALDAAAAVAAIEERIATPLGLSLHEAADGILRVINSKMALAIRELTVAQGLDPRDFTLVAFGGAGPMHAAEIALEAGISQVIFPPVPGMFSAWGMLAADIRHDLVTTAVAKAGDLDAAQVEATFTGLEAEGREVLAGQNVADEAIRYIRSLDLRYSGQEHTLDVEVPTALDPADLKELFDKAHLRQFGHMSDEDPVETVNFRVAAIGRVPKPDLKALPHAGSSQAVPVGQRDVYFDGAFVASDLYERSDIPPGATFSGPAVIDEEGATLVVPPGFDVVCDRYGNLVLSGATRFEPSKEERNGVHAG
jgi:N-methylhydantoinase A